MHHSFRHPHRARVAYFIPLSCPAASTPASYWKLQLIPALAITVTNTPVPIWELARRTYRLVFGSWARPALRIAAPVVDALAVLVTGEGAADLVLTQACADAALTLPRKPAEVARGVFRYRRGSWAQAVLRIAGPVDGAFVAIIAVNTVTKNRIFTDARGADTGKAPEVASRAVHRVGVATLTVHWIARVLGALISVVTIDSGAQNRVLASPIGAHPGQAPEVTSRAVHRVGVATLTVHWIACVLGALISVVAIDSGAQHRVLAHADRADAWKATEVAGRPIGHARVVTLAVHGIAGVLSAFV